MSRMHTWGHQLYSGEKSFNIVGNRRRWYAVSAVLLLVALTSLVVRGINWGIEFTGGAEFQVPAASCTMTQASDAVARTGVQPVSVTELGNNSIRITTESLDNATSLEIRAELAEECQVEPADVSVQVVGPTWGGEITQKAITALLVFLGLLAVFMAIYFDWRMAVAGLVALAHDILLTVGVYSVLGFEVTPSTVIGVLTILGYSLYDTVVVFDKVKENTRGILGQSRQTYGQAANLAVNQTLVRSINTTIVALLPVASVLVVGVGLLGAGTLKDLALALFVGMGAGAYSSIFLATPLLVQLTERDPQMQALARRVASRGSGAAAKGRGGRSAAAAAHEDNEPAPPEAVEAGDEGSPTQDEAMARARARRAASGPRNQPKRTSRAKR